MTGDTIIRKANTEMTGFVRPLDLGTASPKQPVPATAEPQDEIALELIRLRSMLATADSEYERKIAAAREQGRQSAIAGFQRDEAKALAILAEGVSAAAEGVRSEIAALQSLAITLCQNVLGKLLVDPGKQQAFLSGAIAKQVALVHRDSVLSVRVSNVDFAEPSSLADLSTQLGLSANSIQTDPAIAPGSCRMMMRLGQIDLSIPEYLREIQRVLASFDATGGGGT